MKVSEYVLYDGLGLAGLVKRGEVTPGELQAAALQAIAAVNPRLNAVVEHWPEAPTGHANGPLAGVPFLIKDVAIAMAGKRLELGSRIAAGHVAAEDSNLMRHFRRAGLVTIGRTASPEMAFSTTTESLLHGATRNPWHLGHSAGGSSGGSAAAVAAGIVPIAHATDAAGSIRVPAASTGLFGLKPTRGRVSNGPGMDEVFNGFGVQLGVSRTVRDSAALLDAINLPDAGEPYFTPPPGDGFLADVTRAPGRLRIGVMAAAWSGQRPAPETLACLEQAARLCRELGHEVDEASLDIGVSWESFVHANAQIWCANLVGWIDAFAAACARPADLSTLEPSTLACYEYGKRAPATAFVGALETRNRVSRAVAAYFEGRHVLMTPALPDVAQAIGNYAAGTAQHDGLAWTGHVFRHSPYTPVFNVAGTPAMSVPIGHDAAGLPIGIQFAAGWGNDGLLFRLAGQLEEAAPWNQRIPPVWAGKQE
ncbi:amidase [Pseudoduganella umbonata]|uniref:Amidase n=1 Tax=Pseudoduganella umbonata TaxID=864828 RepID=A0A4P8HUP2_9BURK|nr:amidase [Pseudoduganella umbonata]MBB3222914.1 amidase [Pseudoduganella umbonata]QCP13036.1 amidase [Pseudoduganella umbonata]